MLFRGVIYNYYHDERSIYCECAKNSCDGEKKWKILAINNGLTKQNIICFVKN